MKLIICPECSDVVALRRNRRYCECGKVSGRYINDLEAEVTANAVSLAIGNGALQNAVLRLYAMNELVRQKKAQPMDREEWIESGRITHVWVRPNTGPGNPHTKIFKEK